MEEEVLEPFHATGTLRLTVVTPEATVLETPARFIALPLFDGEIGIAPGHSPMIGRLGYGEMRVENASGSTQRFYVDGGFVQVVANTVSVITNRAIPSEKIDAGVAQEQLNAARAREAHSEEQLAIRDRLETQARAQIRTAERAGSSRPAGH